MMQNHNSSGNEGGLSYSEAFPPLPENETGSTSQRASASPWGSSPAAPAKGRLHARMAVQSTTTTESLVISYEERRFKSDENRSFGKDAESEKSNCCDIMRDTGAQIAMTQNKDQSLTLLISGKREDVKKARNMALQRLQTQANVIVPIPKEYHRFILGPKGKTKEEMEVATATKISVPKMDDVSDSIRISGPKEGIEIARDKILQIYELQSKRGAERLPIPKIYHPFFVGGNKSIVERLRETGVSINIPPPGVQRDEISISGEKEAVALVKTELLRFFNEIAQKSKVLTVEVPRGQHKYVQGFRSNHLHDILEKTGVWVELPAQDADSDSVTLRGNPTNFGDALNMVWMKANSVVKVEIKAPNWIHKFMIGRGGDKVRELGQQYPEVHVTYSDEDKIIVEGPPNDVDAVRRLLEAEAKTLVNTMAVEEMKVDEKHMKHIIGKSGANVSRLKTDLKVQIRSSDANRPNVLVVEGEKAAVAEAVKILKERIGKMENERSKDIIIDRRLHKLIIGQKGESIREIRDKFTETNVAFPDAEEKSDVVTIRGPKEEVEKCFKHLEKLVKELIANNHRIEVPIFKDMHRSIIGKGGATIRKIREETDTRIDLPAENADSDVIVITGKKENAEKAKEMIQKIQNELANAVEVKLTIPNKLHTYLIGARGRTIQGVVQECGNVHIQVPQPGSGSDEIIVRGPKADAEKARDLLNKIAQDKELSSYTVDIPAKQEYHRYILGANRANVAKLRERYNVRIVIPSASQEDTDKDIIAVIGRKEDVDRAKVEIEKTLKDLQNTVDDTVQIPIKYHQKFTARRAETLREIQAEAGSVNITFPPQGREDETVQLRGPRDAVDAAKRLLLQYVEDWESYITIEVDIPPQYYGHVMGPKGSRVTDICVDFNVHIKFPDRKDNRNGDKGNGDAQQNRQQPTKTEVRSADDQELNGSGENGSEENGLREEETQARREIVTVTGKPEDCEAAKEALLSLVPVMEEVEVPFEHHRGIIGRGGDNIRRLMDQFRVNINVPNADQKSDIIKITGLRKNVDDAKKGIYDEVKELERRKEEQVLRSFRADMQIDPKYHFQLIGVKGVEIHKLRQEFDVDIQFPRKDDVANADRVTLTGFEDKVNAARDKIQSIIDDLNSKTVLDVQLDNRIHARIIGGRGLNLRKLMDRFKVDIRFPRREDADANRVTITGDEQNCYDAEDELKRLEDQYLDDVVENEALRSYHAPSRQLEPSGRGNGNPQGFVVRGAPWEQPGGKNGGPAVPVPQSGDLEQFPTLAGMGNGQGNGVGAAPPSNTSSSRWGAPR